MEQHCTNCGAEIREGQRFCVDCGCAVEMQVQEQQQQSSGQRQATTKRSSVLVLIILIVCLVRWVGPRVNTSWAVDTACAEVKSEVYSSFGEIPSVSGELVYKQGDAYIVAVRYGIPGWNWDEVASCACLVRGSKDHSWVSNQTTEMAYDFDYNEQLEELKVLWVLE